MFRVSPVVKTKHEDGEGQGQTLRPGVLPYTFQEPGQPRRLNEITK